MGAGSFFSGLLGGYTGTIVKNEARAYNQEMSARELDVKSSLSALDEAVKTGDQNAIQAATSNFERAVNSIREPFQYHRGGGKGKKAQQGEGDPLIQKIVQAMTLHHAQQRSQQPMSEKIPSGPQAGQLAQAVGIPAVPARSASAQAPALPEIPSLSSALGALPSVQKQAQTAGQSKAAEINSLTEGIVNWDQKQGLQITPEEKVAIQQHLAGIVPRLSTGKVLTGSFTPGTALPADATDPAGQPIPSSARTKDNAFGTWQAPDGSFHYFSIKPPGLTASAGQDKVNLVNGVPASVHYQGQTYPLDAKNMPDGARALLEAATEAHIKSRNEKQQDAIMRDNMMIKRMRYGALDLTDKKEARKIVRKDIVDYQDAQRRLGIMEKNLPAALKGNQQAMVAILYNHVGMTALAQRGARQTRALIEEAERSRPWLQGIVARVQKGEPLSGIALSPEQMQFMVQLAEEVDQNMREGVETSAQEMFGDDWRSQLKDVAPGFFDRRFQKGAHKDISSPTAPSPRPKTADEYLKSIGVK